MAIVVRRHRMAGYWLIFPVLAAFLLSFVAAQVLSWRRSSGERRQQLKWLMSGAAVLAVSEVIFQPVLALYPHLPQVQLVVGFLVGLGAAALPASMAVAILKYRLYDIDRIISRTLAYAIVTGLLIGVYAGLVLLATAGAPVPHAGGGGRRHAGGGGAVQSAAAAGPAGGGPAVQPGPV